MVEYGFDAVGSHRIELGGYAYNTHAQRVHDKVGFTREGVRRDALCRDGAWHDGDLDVPSAAGVGWVTRVAVSPR